jgi:hypothetical protein
MGGDAAATTETDDANALEPTETVAAV